MNIVETILTAANITNRESHFVKPPATTYAVWMDDVDTDGPDYINAIFEHDYTIELYSYAPDPTAESNLEAALDAAEMRWTKQARYWISEEQLYQTVYEFPYIEKRRRT